ncbi:hypothetical protein F5X99DRAFT_385101 [Biscogniauxia marginata]|nr:hypothetical protein F5X99DRAFT_385101 [Biscogniauxia marginata]
MVDSLIDTVECLSGKSGSAFEFNHRDFRFHCCLGESGKSTLAITTSTSSQPMKTARMSLAGYSASETTTIVNDTCETVRYRINDSSKHVVEEVAMGILSLMPTFGIDKLSKIPSAVHKATKIAEWISAGLTMKSMWHSVIQDSSSIRGILFPKDQVERTTTSSNIRNANDVVIERYSIETSTNSIVVDTYEYSRAQTETFYLKDIIVDGEPPSGWTKSTEKWSLFQSKDCKPDRAIQIPNFGVKVGECNIETFNQSPHGAFYCICSDELKARMFPYMTTANVDNHETLGIYDESKCSYYIQSKDGSRHGSRVMSLPTKKHIPVVVLEQTRLRKRGTLEPVELGTAEERQDVDHTVLTKIEDESARGRSYWGVSVEQDRVIRGYPEVPPDYRDKKWVLQKAKKSLCRTYFVGNHWVPVY